MNLNLNQQPMQLVVQYWTLWFQVKLIKTALVRFSDGRTWRNFMFIFILYGSEGTKEHLFFLLLSPTHMSLFLLLLQFIVVLLLLPPPFLLLLSSSLPPFTPSFQHLRIWFGAVTVVCPALSLVTWVQSFLRVNSFHFLRPQ